MTLSVSLLCTAAFRSFSLPPSIETSQVSSIVSFKSLIELFIDSTHDDITNIVAYAISSIFE